MSQTLRLLLRLYFFYNFYKQSIFLSQFSPTISCLHASSIQFHFIAIPQSLNHPQLVLLLSMFQRQGEPWWTICGYSLHVFLDILDMLDMLDPNAPCLDGNLDLFGSFGSPENSSIGHDACHACHACHDAGVGWWIWRIAAPSWTSGSRSQGSSRRPWHTWHGTHGTHGTGHGLLTLLIKS